MFYLTLVLPPGAVPVGGVVEVPGIVPFRSFCDDVVPLVSVGWESFRPVVETVPEVVISLLFVVLCIVVCIDVVGVVIGAVVFLPLPQAKSAQETARTKNIARIFFMEFSLIVVTVVY